MTVARNFQLQARHTPAHEGYRQASSFATLEGAYTHAAKWGYEEATVLDKTTGERHHAAGYALAAYYEEPKRGKKRHALGPIELSDLRFATSYARSKGFAGAIDRNNYHEWLPTPGGKAPAEMMIEAPHVDRPSNATDSDGSGHTASVAEVRASSDVVPTTDGMVQLAVLATDPASGEALEAVVDRARTEPRQTPQAPPSLASVTRLPAILNAVVPDNLTVSWSEIAAARQCPHKHEKAYKERWTKEDQGARYRGTLFHLCAEKHYGYVKSIYPVAATDFARPWNDDQICSYIESNGWDAWKLEHPLGREWWALMWPLLYQPDGVTQTETQILVEWMLKGYLSYYGFDEGWSIKAVEHCPTYKLADGVMLKTKIDLVVEVKVRSRPTLWIVDHKSAANLPKERELDLDDQFGLYAWVLRQNGKPIFGCIYNAARAQMNKSDVEGPPILKSGKVSTDLSKQPQALSDRHRRILLDRNDTELDTIAAEALETVLHVYSYPLGKAPRHPDTEMCVKRCDFTEACLSSRKGIASEAVFLRSLGFEQNYTRH